MYRDAIEVFTTDIIPITWNYAPTLNNLGNGDTIVNADVDYDLTSSLVVNNGPTYTASTITIVVSGFLAGITYPLTPVATTASGLQITGGPTKLYCSA